MSCSGDKGLSCALVEVFVAALDCQREAGGAEDGGGWAHRDSSVESRVALLSLGLLKSMLLFGLKMSKSDFSAPTSGIKGSPLLVRGLRAYVCNEEEQPWENAARRAMTMIVMLLAICMVEHACHSNSAHRDELTSSRQAYRASN